MAIISDNSTVNVNETGPAVAERVSRVGETPTKRISKALLVPVLHLLCCVTLALCMVYILDGYLAVSATASRNINGGKFKLRVSDVTTLISTALTIIRLLVAAWTSVVIWNCVFVLLERPGMTLSQINLITSFYIPPVPRHYAGLLVTLLLVLVIPQQLISPIVSGAVDWSDGYEFSPDPVQVLAGNPAASPLAWFWYYYSGQSRRGYVRRAAALAAITWDDSAPDRRHCRHVMSESTIPINSTVLNAVIPCIQIHSITFPRSPPGTNVLDLVIGSDTNEDVKLSRAGDAPLQYALDGNAVLFDPDDRPGLFDAFPARDDTAFVMDVPTAYKQDGLMTAVVLINGTTNRDGTNCTSLRENIFGLTSFNNIFTTTDGGNYDRCYTHAVVKLTAGIATSPVSTYISGRVVEADARDMDTELTAGPWVKEAMYLMPDVMSVLSMMNTTPLYTWEDLEGYTDKLIRYSYQATWDMLSRSFEPNPSSLKAIIWEKRLVASVSRIRVYAWLAVSVLLAASSALLVFGRRGLEREMVLDGIVAALVTDPSGVLQKAGHGLAGLSYVTKQDDKLGRLQIRRGDVGEYSLVIVASPTSDQGSMDLAR